MSVLLQFHSNVTNKSILAVQIFDQKKFKKKDQGFLGTVNIQMGDVFDVNNGGDGMDYCACPRRPVLAGFGPSNLFITMVS